MYQSVETVNNPLTNVRYIGTVVESLFVAVATSKTGDEKEGKNYALLESTHSLSGGRRGLFSALPPSSSSAPLPPLASPETSTWFGARMSVSSVPKYLPCGRSIRRRRPSSRFSFSSIDFS